MRNMPVNEECFVLPNNHLAVTQLYTSLALGHDKEVVMLMGVQFRWPSTIEVYISNSPVKDTSHLAKKPFGMEVNVSGWCDKLVLVNRLSFCRCCIIHISVLI